MNRLSPLIVRRVGPMAATAPSLFGSPLQDMAAPAWLDDARMFATGWIGGLIFFSTYLG